MSAGLVAVAGLAAALGFATPSPSPTTGGELDPLDVSPGLLGFAVTFALVLASIGLFVSMTRKIRGVNRGPDGAPGEPDAPAGPAGPAGD